MAKQFCLLPNKLEDFKKALKAKELKIADLLNMSSKERTELLRKYAGKNAEDVNRLFEQKLVLKNKQIGIKNWASKVAQIGRYSPQKKKEFLKMAEEFKLKQQERIFNPKESETFLNDLADSAIGTHITREEAGEIFKLSSKTEDLKTKFNPETNEWASKKDAIDYGVSKVLLENYVDSLKTETMPVKDMLLARYYKGKETFKENKAKAVTDLLADIAKTMSDNAIAFVASVDNSFLGRQGLNTLITKPRIWADTAKKSFSDFYKTIVKKDGAELAKGSLMADAYSRPNYINGNYEKAKLIPKAEEQFPTTLPERIPGVGRVFKASETAFSNAAIRTRINLFDNIEEIARKNGVEINDEQVKDLGTLINSLTARGDLGRLGEGGLVKLVLWAPKMLKANYDVLTAHTLGAGLKTPFARAEAKKNLLKIVASTATVAAIANALKPGSVETDPVSSDFMRIKEGDTRFDITSGKGSLINLLARGLTMESKSTMTGIKTPLGSGEFGSRSYFDVGIDFLSNKTAPFAKAIIDYTKGEDFEGKKPTIKSALYKTTTPISIQNFVKNFYGEDPENSVASILGSILDLVGVGANTYSTKDDWMLKESKELSQLLSDIGEDKFKMANKEYNGIIKEQIDSTIKTEEFKRLSSEEQLKKIAKIKNDAKKRIFKKYNP